MRDIPVTGVAHPLVDQVGEVDGRRYVLTESRAAVVHLNPARVNLLSQAIAADRQVVLVTDELSVLTGACAEVWRDAGAAWVVRDAEGGLREGFVGRRLDRVEDVFTASPPASVDDVAVGFLRPTPGAAMQVMTTVSLRHRPRITTLLGGPAAELARVATGAEPQAWGAHEPIGTRWDREALTTFVRERMPADTLVLVGADGVAEADGVPGPDGVAGPVEAPRLRATITGRRTEHGVEEITQASLGLPGVTVGEFATVRDRLAEVFSRLAETAMPLIGLALARPGRADLMVPPRLQAPPMPVALLIGPPAVRGFGIAPESMVEQFGARVVGRPRIPGLVFTLGDYGPTAWERLDAVLAAVGRDRLAPLLGLGPQASTGEGVDSAEQP